jgi:UDP-glucose 4-epimerase
MSEIKDCVFLITGGCGFVGINLVKYLLENQKVRKIKILDNLSTGKEEYLQSYISDMQLVSCEGVRDKLYKTAGGAVVELIKGDVRDLELVHRTTEGVDFVMHLAAQSGVIPSIQNPKFSVEVNVLGTLNCLEASRANNVKKFIFASSGAPLGDSLPPFHEDVLPRPISPYGATKLSGEALCRAYHHSYGLNITSLRFSNAYGPGSYHKESVVATFIKRVLQGNTLIIYGDGNQTRDFLYISDLCQAIYLSLSLNIDVLQIASGEETSINKLVSIIRELSLKYLNRDISVEYAQRRKGEIVRNFADISKARAFGFKPMVKIEDGVERTLKWFMER